LLITKASAFSLPWELDWFSRLSYSRLPFALRAGRFSGGGRLSCLLSSFLAIFLSQHHSSHFGNIYACERGTLFGFDAPRRSTLRNPVRRSRLPGERLHEFRRRRSGAFSNSRQEAFAEIAKCAEPLYSPSNICDMVVSSPRAII
jgi:hypothetical protein